MKQVIITIRPNKYLETKEALAKARFYALTAIDVFGRGKNAVKYRTGEDETQEDIIHEDILTVKKQIEIYINDSRVDELTDIILKVNRTGNEGDGRIFILPCEECVRIHTLENGEDALN